MSRFFTWLACILISISSVYGGIFAAPLVHGPAIALSPLYHPTSYSTSLRVIHSSSLPVAVHGPPPTVVHPSETVLIEHGPAIALSH